MNSTQAPTITITSVTGDNGYSLFHYCLACTMHHLNFIMCSMVLKQKCIELRSVLGNVAKESVQCTRTGYDEKERNLLPPLFNIKMV